VLIKNTGAELPGGVLKGEKKQPGDEAKKKEGKGRDGMEGMRRPNLHS